MGKKLNIKIGDQFGKWTVIKTDVINPNSKSKTPYKCCLCECSCEKHTQSYVRPSALYNGKSTCCGCDRLKNLAERNANNSSVKIGNIYGKLTVIKDLGMRKQNSRNKNERWSLCQCSCGSPPIEVKNNMLQNGWKKSCGCLSSEGERKIESILKENNINYIKEYKFLDLVGDEGQPLRFDFAVLDKTNNLSFLIEFDGRQHFTGPEGNWTYSKTLEEIQKYDELKNNYCKQHNYLLKRIPFFQMSKISLKTLYDNTFNI